MLKIFIPIFLSFCFLACSSKSPSPSAMVEGIDEQCFQYIVKNKTKDFIARISDCKGAHKNGVTSLSFAIAKENMDIVQALIDAGVDVNEVDPAGQSALVFAANKNNKRIVQLLRRAGARVEIVNKNLTGLMMAVRNSSLELIEVMNPTPEEINLAADDGWTALHFAITRRDLEIFKYLLDHGACTQIRDADQQWLIDYAREEKWSEAVTILSRRKGKC